VFRDPGWCVKQPHVYAFSRFLKRDHRGAIPRTLRRCEIEDDFWIKGALSCINTPFVTKLSTSLRRGLLLTAFAAVLPGACVKADAVGDGGVSSPDTGQIIDEPPWPGARSVEVIGVHDGEIEGAAARADAVDVPAGLVIRPVDPHDRAEIARWTDVVLAGFGMDGPNADAWRRLAPFLLASKGEHTFLAALHGRDVAAAQLFTRRRVGWIGNATVLPEARGQGVQRALIAHRICAAVEAGCRRVMATADAGSRSAANLEAMGLRSIWTNGLYRLDPTEPA